VEKRMKITSGMRILVIDDMPPIVKLVDKMLRNMGFNNVYTSCDGSLAWKLLEKSKIEEDYFNFIISDWNMPMMTGLELLKKVRSDELYERLPFLMLTAESEQGSVIQAIKSGVSSYVVKPFSEEVLKRKINEIFE
jgi:two-component system, chemotaxis family, chemotaxis protein CheY